jgi:hypothetical protein
MESKIVIVGGGPIGCWTALQVKSRNPHLDVTIYERSRDYQRDHIMTIRRSSFLRWSARSAQNDRLLAWLFGAQATCSELCGPRAVAPASGGVAEWLDIRTLDFERIVKEDCGARGIRFVYKKVESPGEVMEAHPDCLQFIAADGANSRMRTAIWGADCLSRYDILPSLDFKYKAIGQPRYLLKSTFDRLAHMGLENINLEGPDGCSDVNLRFVVSQTDYDAIPSATFKEPLIVTPDAAFWSGMSRKPLYTGRTFREDFYDFLEMRRAFAGERIADAPITMTKIYLSRYAAREFARTIGCGARNRTWFLVGDAATGMPFYRSVNSGLILGSQLGLLLSTRRSARQRVRIYNHLIRPARVASEFRRTRYLECKAHALMKVIRPILFHAARMPGLRAPIVEPFDVVARWRGARFP